MDDSLRKRQRTQNWAPEEKHLLLALCEKHLKYIENKKADSQTSNLKNLAWRSIHNEFVQMFGLDRDPVRLKEQWRRMKGWARAEMQEYENVVKKIDANISERKRPSSLSERVWKVMETAQKYAQDDDDEDNMKTLLWQNSLEIDGSTSNHSGESSKWDEEEYPDHTSDLCEVEIKEEPLNSQHVTNNTNQLPVVEHLLDTAQRPYVQIDSANMSEHRLQGLVNLKKSYDLYEPDTQTQPIQTYGNMSTTANKSKKRKIDGSEDPLEQSFEHILLEIKQFEHSKKMDIMEEQLLTARLNRETADINKRIAQETLRQLLAKNM